MTADVKFTKRGNVLYAKHRVQSYLAAVFLVATLILFSEVKGIADSNTPLAILFGLAAGLAAILTIRSVVRAAAYLSVSAMVDAFGLDEGDDR